MKKILMVVGAITLIIVALGAAGVAYAQDATPPDGCLNDGSGTPMGGGRGMRGSGMTGEMGSMAARMGSAGMMSNGTGLLADYMHTAMAEALGLSVDELIAREEAGDTAWDIAAEQGLTFEEFQALMTTARQTAIDQAIADGVISADQGARMFGGQGGRGGMRGGSGTGTGDCTGGGTGHGMHGGRNVQP